MKLVMGLQTTAFIWICLVLGIQSFQEDPSMGRIKDFDAILMRYTRNIAKGLNMESVIMEFEQVDGDITSDKRMKDYYYEVCRGISKEGDSYILSERNRLNVIISGASKNEKGMKETEYAYKRRNILEAFVDAAAQHVMQEFNMDPAESIKLDAADLGEEFVQTLNMDNIKLDHTKKGPQTIKMDASQFKIKTVKKKKQSKHDEM